MLKLSALPKRLPSPNFEYIQIYLPNIQVTLRRVLAFALKMHQAERTLSFFLIPQHKLRENLLGRLENRLVLAGSCLWRYIKQSYQSQPHITIVQQ